MGKYDDYKHDVLRCSQWLSEHGYFGTLTGSGGNVSIRVIDRNFIVITPSSRSYKDIAVDDICVLDYDLNPIEGELPPSIEAGMHIGIYKKRPDINAVVHTHQTFASLCSVINKPIPALFDEVSLNIGDTVDIIPYAFSGTTELVENVVGKLDNRCHCYIMQNHGALSLGSTLDRAMLNAEILEKVAEIYYYALTTGIEITILPDTILDRIMGMRGGE